MSATTFEPPLQPLGGAAEASVCAPEQFNRWLQTAKPRDRIVYAVARWLPPKPTTPLLRLLDAEYDNGWILFSHQKLPDGRFQYFAIRKERQVRPAPMKRFVPRGVA